jgi:3-(methylthio)propanoyl-CoA dehydrogenase
VHGGMGYIEETGAAQYMRDVRITTIYEGTTGIQSNDLIGRKLGRDRGAAMLALIADMQRELQAPAGDEDVEAIRRAALEAVDSLALATQALLQTLATHPDVGMAVSVPYLKLCGYAGSGWLLARAAVLAAAKRAGPESEFYRAKIRTAAFYAAQVLPLAAALARIVCAGGASVVATDAALV